MFRSVLFVLISLLVFVGLSGCGGLQVPTSSTISGTVLDADNNAVRGALVSAGNSQTQTSSSGAYVLHNVKAGEVKVVAEITRNSVKYRGSTWALTFENETSQNVNIVVGVASQSATVFGQVQDRDGFALENASVYAYNGAGSSVRAFTDNTGQYVIEDLIPNTVYTISGTGQGYRSDQEDVLLSSGESRRVDLILGTPLVTAVDPPTNIGAVSWVSPSSPSFAAERGDYVSLIKSLIDERYENLKAPEDTTSQTRATDHAFVEVDVFWDDQYDEHILGYAVYRARLGQQLSFLDFHADPIAGYFVDLTPFGASTYVYGVTTLSTTFPDGNETESALSDLVQIETLDLLNLAPPTFNPLTIRWLNGSLASEYVVFFFSEYPSVGVSAFWDNIDSPSFGTSYVYDGPSLTPGKTYYYVVLGLNNDWSARTISPVGSFIP